MLITRYSERKSDYALTWTISLLCLFSNCQCILMNLYLICVNAANLSPVSELSLCIIPVTDSTSKRVNFELSLHCRDGHHHCHHQRTASTRCGITMDLKNLWLTFHWTVKMASFHMVNIA